MGRSSRVPKTASTRSSACNHFVGWAERAKAAQPRISGAGLTRSGAFFDKTSGYTTSVLLAVCSRNSKVMDTGPKVLCSERRSAEMLAVSMQGSRRDVRAPAGPHVGLVAVRV